MSHHHHHHVANDLLRSQRDIAREEARARMGDPPNTACRLKLAVGAKPNINDKMADRGRKALRGPIIGFLIASALLLPISAWTLVVLIPWAIFLLGSWVEAPKRHAAELERRRSVEAPAAVGVPAPRISDEEAAAVTAPMTRPMTAQGPRRHAR